jgi:hypothetical protein
MAAQNWVSVICTLMVALLPFGAVAQITEPLLPVPTPPSGPQAPAAPGQPTYPGQTVTQRPRPEYNPIGMRVGDFFWFPHAEFDEAYNSNIFATPIATSDFTTLLQPGFDLLSSFPRNALNFHAGAVSQFYAEHPAQNTQNGSVAVDGQVDVTAGSWFYGGAQAAHLDIPRTSPNSPGNAAEPVTYNSYSANAGYTQTKVRLVYQAEAAVQYVQYNSVPLIGGGTLSQSSNDVTVSQTVLRSGYEFVPDYQGYIRLSGNLRDYEHTAPGAVRLNSVGYRIDVGLEIFPRHVLYGDVYFGYLNQSYDISSLGSIAAPDAGGRLVWNVTPLTTATLTGLRTVVQSNQTVATTGAGYLASTVVGNIDHELLRNLLVNANAGYENDPYQGNTRTDNVFNAGAGLKYLVNRNIFLGCTYSYQQRKSSVSGLSYTQNIVMLRLGTQF